LVPEGVQEHIAVYESAMRHYLDQDWPGALELFREALKLLPGNRASVILRDRCELYLKNPPDHGWFGAFVLQEK
jgi:hypothetical protein